MTLGDYRKVGVRVLFTSEGAVIELHYIDPLYLPAANGKLDFDSLEELKGAPFDIDL